MKYMLLCHQCSNKVFTDGKDLSDLTEIPQAPLPKRGNGTKETVTPKKKLKCPKCGYLLHIVRLVLEKPKEEESKEPPTTLF